MVGGEHGHDPHGHGVLVFFREGGDDTKAVALDSVVSDTGHVAEVDDLALEGLQPLRVGRADGRQRERGSKGGLADRHGGLLVTGYIPALDNGVYTPFFGNNKPLAMSSQSRVSRVPLTRPLRDRRVRATTGRLSLSRTGRARIPV